MLSALLKDKSARVDFLPQVVKAINDNYAVKPSHIDGDDEIRGSKNALHILSIGTNVRVQLDNPQNHLTGSRLFGKFREGDVRWTKEPKQITQLYLRPNQPPMYKVGNNGNVAYTKNQLQVVDKNEIKPNINLQQKWIINKLIRRYKKGNKIMYEVKWSDGSITQEPRSNLIKDVPLLVKEFEKK